MVVVKSKFIPEIVCFYNFRYKFQNKLAAAFQKCRVGQWLYNIASALIPFYDIALSNQNLKQLII
jgi:hypothetical protein